METLTIELFPSDLDLPELKGSIVSLPISYQALGARV